MLDRCRPESKDVGQHGSCPRLLLDCFAERCVCEMRGVEGGGYMFNNHLPMQAHPLHAGKRDANDCAVL